MLKAIPKEYFDGARGTLKLLYEEEWRGLGITQSLGWEHYEVHEPEPHILLFKSVACGCLKKEGKTLTRSADGRSTTRHRSTELDKFPILRTSMTSITDLEMSVRIGLASIKTATTA